MTPRAAPARGTWAMLAMLACQGFAIAINGVAAPWIMQSFGLSEAGMARLFAWISLSALGAWALTRIADRTGRRRVLTWCLVLTPVSAAGAATASSLWWFTLCEIVLHSSAAAGIATGVAWLAEALPDERRATGQGWAGMALAASNAACLVLMPALVRAGASWRSLLYLLAAGIVVAPFIARSVRESAPWQHDAVAARRTRDLVRPPHRAYALPILAATAIGTIAVTAATPWRYFRAVAVLDVSPAMASALLLGTGAISLAGFQWAPWLCDRFGRVRLLVATSLLTSASIAWSYWGPPAGVPPVLWLAAGFTALGLAINAGIVGLNTLVTERFPPALRTTMLGSLLIMGALGQLASQTATAAAAPLAGGVSPVIGWLGWLCLPVAAVYGWLVHEPARAGAASVAHAHADEAGPGLVVRLDVVDDAGRQRGDVRVE